MKADFIHGLLSSFPLFYGMSNNDLQEVVAHTKFDFRKLRPGTVVAREDEACDRLILLADGTLTATYTSFDHGYSVEEPVAAPYTVQPERLFGMRQMFTATFITATTCSLIVISRDEVRRLVDTIAVTRMNYIHILALAAQKSTVMLWRPPATTTRQRVVRFLRTHCLRPAGPKTFHILMIRLASEINDSRLDVSKALNQMKREGLVRLGRGKIGIENMEKIE